jgi:HPt (histidine-containing phosphotransfer) domain-containing protein
MGTPEALAAPLTQTAKRWSHMDTNPPSVHESMPPPASDSVIDYDVLDAFGGTGPDANEFVATLVQLFLTESAANMAQLKDAAARQDAPTLGRAAHRLKGSAGAVGALGLTAICGELEILTRDAALQEVPVLIVRLEREAECVREALGKRYLNAADETGERPGQ